ncbi:SixA phosphatase family protein [Pelodictyon luteolum]|uniref:Putative phosphohistidine phosphatase, SixA n=1 Tax=Chlorobium luteolum (strain DSM 273 / BCRC 81028 / 2530) TaxID=319225 RepID=Q3B183_CHLL3|nr:histidine phosphatase family protein [Pelodictyon luteolum]ABB24898.1 putative phosphohistidine phosphatase, SixA [Pelodictyon luteolum DSM 273]
MKTLYLVRHAKAGWSADAASDFERTLSERGITEAHFMARLVHERDPRPDMLVTSPAVRALTTAETFAGVFDIPPESIIQNMEIYHGGASELLDIVRSLPDDAGSVMLFGHNPVMSELANRLGDMKGEAMETCSVVRLDFQSNRWSEAGPGKGLMVWHEHPEKRHTR